MNYYYANENNQTAGPCTAEQMRLRYQRGVIGANSWVIAEGSSEWKPYVAVFGTPEVQRAPAASAPPVIISLNATANNGRLTNRAVMETERPADIALPFLVRFCDFEGGCDSASRQLKYEILRQKVQNIVFWSLFVGIVYPATLFWIFEACALFSGDGGRTSAAWKASFFFIWIVGAIFQCLTFGFAFSVKQSWKWRLVLGGLLVPASISMLLVICSRDDSAAALAMGVVSIVMNGLCGSFCRDFFDQDWLSPDWDSNDSRERSSLRAMLRPFKPDAMCPKCSSKDIAPQYRYHLRPILIAIIFPPIGWLMRMQPVETCPLFLFPFESFLKNKKSADFVTSRPTCLSCGYEYGHSQP